MKNLKHPGLGVSLTLAVSLGAGFLALAADAPKEPARLEVSVSPSPATPGDRARVTVQIRPLDGVKINRYPKIKLDVPATEGLVAEARVEIGEDRPPPPDKMNTNYYTTVDPVELDLTLAADAPSGRYELDAKLTYYYCVTASGFCAPARVPIKIPLAVR